MPIVCKRQHILFNKFKTNLSRNDNADNTVGQPSKENARSYFRPKWNRIDQFYFNSKGLYSFSGAIIFNNRTFYH
ncbi:hypothetical protein BCR32DRAFT_296359 [Anaeromyces robustus]|uniref:Uncharacterized protein n=1 Tax=Anaeromyces robustus TaxID=1754192 RepID=A0A1Y1WS58_9FUNG|nr:hypothetical protein BCR32DRAFT_296359 [Anaeromyces robustus]|eukprot:ORX76235.1 hypothetical protein BCR32DRAFT_296359 [Anaeromyces robustus]